MDLEQNLFESSPVLQPSCSRDDIASKMGVKTLNVTDAHYFGIPSQGNVYTLTQLQMNNGVNKFLVASLRRKVVSFEYIESGGVLKPTVKEVPFTYIPSGAEIISIDAFNKSPSSNDFVIGITIIKGPAVEPQPMQTLQDRETYLNIYSEWEPGSEFNLDSVAQSCLSLELQFIPYQLYHTTLPSQEVVWLLSGSDETIHMYREDKANHCYQETDLGECFPELCDYKHVVLWLDICYTTSKERRMSAVGCESGEVRLNIVDIATCAIVARYEKGFEGPITSVRLFSCNYSNSNPLAMWETKETPDPEKFHLLVTNGLQPSAVYMDVLQNGLDNFNGLPDSNRHDCVLCSCVADVDMDGKPELLLGTYGQEVVVYKYGTSWDLNSHISLANPIFSLAYVDVTGDGMRELVAMTLKGVHILQHNIEEIETLLRQRMVDLSSIASNLG